jgi:putative transcriptional regulator
MNIGDNNLEPAAGVVLIAAANLLDPNFTRTVILLCEHQYDGTFGLVLNNALPIGISDVVESEMAWDAPLHRGGPVQENTLHFLHSIPGLEIGSIEVLPGVMWGGDFGQLSAHLDAHKTDVAKVRFFVGYSGWGEGQLTSEIERDSWYLIKGRQDAVFCEDAGNHWRSVVRSLGPEYQILSNFPDDPRLN